jgi:hypothetical protein|tara:strand:+ start:69 stop:449 length:381 start_codon:yes stop_codon:yes gene_type:complete
MTITNETTIETLITLGLISSDQIESWNKRATKLEARQASRQLVQGTSEIIMELLNSDLQSDTRFFSVKTTSNSVGFMSFVETDRATVLKALTLLVKQDKIKKVGVVGGEVKLPTDVNAFQIRYMRA